MPLINCKVNLILTWSSNCVITNSIGARRFAITDTKLYVPVVVLSTQDNAKLFQQLKSGFNRTISWNKYQSNISVERQNQCLDFLIDPNFQGVKRLSVPSFENESYRTTHTRYYLPKGDIKDQNLKIDGKPFLINQQIAILKHLKTLEKLPPAKDMIRQLIF